MRCIYCAVCEECQVCQKCRVCKYPARQLVPTKRSTLSNESIKRRIGAKSKSSVIVPLLSENELVPKIQKLKKIGTSKLETKCVGDKLKGKILETKIVGDKNNGPQGTNNVAISPPLVKNPILVSESNTAKVSKLLNFNIDLKVSNLN